MQLFLAGFLYHHSCQSNVILQIFGFLYSVTTKFTKVGNSFSFFIFNLRSLTWLLNIFWFILSMFFSFYSLTIVSLKLQMWIWRSVFEAERPGCTYTINQRIATYFYKVIPASLLKCYLFKSISIWNRETSDGYAYNLIFHSFPSNAQILSFCLFGHFFLFIVTRDLPRFSFFTF